MEKLTLITGEFSHAEAREILMNVFSTKINFHQLKNFSSQERFGEEDATALQRIPALRAEVKRLENILLAAKNGNQKLRIRSELIIEYIDETAAADTAEDANIVATLANQSTAG